MLLVFSGCRIDVYTSSRRKREADGAPDETNSLTDEYRLTPGTVSETALAGPGLGAQRFKSANQLTTTVIGGAFGSLALIAARKR